MLKFIVFTICLILSPTFGLIQNLLQVENDCYSGCWSNYVENLSNLDACKKGCDYRLQNEKCTDQCKLLSIDGQIRASCLVGCSMITSVSKNTKKNNLLNFIINFKIIFIKQVLFTSLTITFLTIIFPIIILLIGLFPQQSLPQQLFS